MRHFAQPSVHHVLDGRCLSNDGIDNAAEDMQAAVEDYFLAEDEDAHVDATAWGASIRTESLVPLSQTREVFVRADILEFLRGPAGRTVDSPLAVARIMYGLGSPRFPVREWCRHPQWASCAELDFHDLLRVASRAMADHREIVAKEDMKVRGLFHEPNS